MITKMFAVYDLKACVFGVPFAMQTTGAAVRAFTDLANDPQSSINRHPADYQLFEIGSFDDGSAKLVSVVPGTLLGCASDFVEAKRPVVFNPAASEESK